jgi:hypothetical protein
MALKHTRVTSTNDSDAVILTAGTNKLIEILNIHVVFTSTATVGNRQILMIIQDDSDVLVSDYHAGAVQAASLTRNYSFARGTYRETSFIDDQIQNPFPFGTVLFPGWDLRIKDDAGIDAAADDMTVNVVYKEFDITTNGTNSPTGLVT